jgi:hypothetical protein
VLLLKQANLEHLGNLVYLESLERQQILDVLENLDYL